MIGAVIKNNIVQNLIIVSTSEIPSLKEFLDCDDIINAKFFGLQAGDLLTSRGWTRNAGGEQMVLQPVPESDWNTFSLNTQKIAQLEEERPQLVEMGAQEALNILTGVDTMEAVDDDKSAT